MRLFANIQNKAPVVLVSPVFEPAAADVTSSLMDDVTIKLGNSMAKDPGSR